jgi:hypothetical protein
MLYHFHSQALAGWHGWLVYCTQPVGDSDWEKGKRPPPHFFGQRQVVQRPSSSLPSSLVSSLSNRDQPSRRDIARSDSSPLTPATLAVTTLSPDLRSNACSDNPVIGVNTLRRDITRAISNRGRRIAWCAVDSHLPPTRTVRPLAWPCHSCSKRLKKEDQEHTRRPLRHPRETSVHRMVPTVLIHRSMASRPHQSPE